MDACSRRRPSYISDASELMGINSYSAGSAVKCWLQIVEYTTKLIPPSFIYLKGFSGQSRNS